MNRKHNGPGSGPPTSSTITGPLTPRARANPYFHSPQHKIFLTQALLSFPEVCVWCLSFPPSWGQWAGWRAWEPPSSPPPATPSPRVGYSMAHMFLNKVRQNQSWPRLRLKYFLPGWGLPG